MFQFIQESVDLPKLSQTSLYRKFNESSDLSQCIVDELKSAKEHIVKASDIQDIVALIKLNGDAIAKKAVEAYKNGQIVVIHNKETSKIPNSLPYIVMTGKNGSGNKVFIFSGTVINNIQSATEYTNLMALLEAAYLALCLTTNPAMILMNRQLVLTLCNIYTLMAVAPLEQRLYMKGENLVKAMLYIISYFYKMIDGENIDEATIPYKRIIADKIDPGVVKQIVEDVKTMPDNSFLTLLEMIKKINPIRYKDLDSMYISYFITTCGVPLIFALENIQYLFMLIASATYKTTITAFGLNKTVSPISKKVIVLMSGMDFHLK